MEQTKVETKIETETESGSGTSEYFPLKPQLVFLIGACGSGKSVALKSIMYYYCKQRYFKECIAFCRTKFNGSYDFLPDRCVHEEWDEGIIKRHVGKLRNYMQRTGKIPPPTCLLLDDMLGVAKTRTGFFANFLATHRHYNMTVFITSQYLIGNITTLMREITNVAVMFNCKFKNSTKAMYEAYGGAGWDNAKEFDAALRDWCSEDYYCMIYRSGETDRAEMYTRNKFGVAPPFKVTFKKGD